MKEIPLTQGYVALVDDEDYEWLSQWKWIVTIRKKTCYAYRAGIWDGEKQQHISMHRQILGLLKGSKEVTDHLDGNGLNNCRANLRACTQNINAQNQHREKPGIYEYKPGKWRTEIRAYGEKYSLSIFTTEVDAKAAYNWLVHTYHKERPIPYPDYPIIVGNQKKKYKLTKDQVAEIRAKYKPGVMTLSMLSHEYGVHVTMISHIIHNNRHKE